MAAFSALIVMRPSDLLFYAFAANPVGGLLVAIPFAILKLDYPVWRAIAFGVPLAYLQVIAVDLGWSVLAAWPVWNRFLERRRNQRFEQLLGAQGAFWATFLATPFIGPWLVMAIMRYGQVSQRRVVLPILSALAATAGALAVTCLTVPQFFANR